MATATIGRNEWQTQTEVEACEETRERNDECMRLEGTKEGDDGRNGRTVKFPDG